MNKTHKVIKLLVVRKHFSDNICDFHYSSRLLIIPCTVPLDAKNKNKLLLVSYRVNSSK